MYDVYARSKCSNHVKSKDKFSDVMGLKDRKREKSVDSRGDRYWSSIKP